MVIDKNRAACYIRVSTQEQARHGLSLGDQRAALEKYVQEHGYVVVGWYEDAGISARKPYKKRPALLRLLEDCKQDKIDTILFIKLDRYFRNVQSYYEVQPILEKHHVTWQATEEDYETVTASGRFKVNIMLSVAQDEADRTSERIKFINNGKRERGEALTGETPYGYKVVDKKIAKDPALEPLVNDVFSVYIRTGSIAKTTEYIEENYGVRLNYGRLNNMLRNTAYAGTYFDTPNMCPAYLTKEQYDKIQSMRKRVVRRSPKNRTYLFSGLCTCGTCGGRMASKCNTKFDNYMCYQCSRHSAHKDDCPNKTTISQKAIQAYLLDALVPKLNEYKLAAKEAARPVDNTSRIKAIENKIKRLKDLYINEIITLDELKADKSNYEAQIAKLSEQKPVPDFSHIDKMLSYGWRDMYDMASPEAKAQFWRSLIKNIRLYQDRHIEFDLNV